MQLPVSAENEVDGDQVADAKSQLQVRGGAKQET